MKKIFIIIVLLAGFLYPQNYIIKDSVGTALNSLRYYSHQMDSLLQIISPNYLPAPTNVVITSGVNELVITWQDNADNENGYIIESSLESTTGFLQIATVSANVQTYTYSGLDTGVEYFIRIKAYTNSGSSSYSSVVSGIPTTASPINFIADGGIESAHLSWTANGSSNFNIERSAEADNNFVYLASTSNTSYIDTPLVEDAIWYYRVQGYGLNYTTAFSDIDSAIIFGTTSIPTAPSNFVLTGKYQSLYAEWRDNSNNEVRFRIMAGNDSASAAQIDSVSANTTSYCYGGLGDGVSKTMYVIAVGIDGNTISNADVGTTTTPIVTDSTATIIPAGSQVASATFESNNFSELTKILKDGNNIIQVSTASALSGTYGVEAYYGGLTDNDLAYGQITFTPNDTIWFKVSLKVPSVCNDSVAYQTAYYLDLRDSATVGGTGSALLRIGGQANGTATAPYKWDFGGLTVANSQVNPTGAMVGVTNTIIGRWIAGDIGATGIQVWVNGVSKYNPAFTASRLSNRADMLRFGLVYTKTKWKDGSKVYIDSIVIANDSLGLFNTGVSDTTWEYVYSQDTEECVAALPLLAINPASINFGSYPSGVGNYTQTVSVTNQGTANATITGISGLASPFSYNALYTLPLTLQPNQSVSILVSFDTNTLPGIYNDVLNITGSNNLTCNITGTLTAPGGGGGTIVYPATLEDTMTYAELENLCPNGTVYVLNKDASGSSNVGTEANPFTSLETALNTLRAGDGLLIKKTATSYIPTGSYTFGYGGTDNQNKIYIRGEYLHDRPIIEFGDNKNLKAAEKDYMVFEALQINNTGNGFWTEGGDYNQFRGLFLNGCASGSTLRIQGHHNLIEYCEVTGTGWNAITIMSHSKNTVTTADDWYTGSNVIRYNYLHDNSAHHSINIFPYVSPSGSDLMPQYADSIEIYGNRMERSNWGIYSRYMRAFKIYNNIIANCNEGGIQLERNYDSGNAGSPDSSRYGTYDARDGLIANNTIYNSYGTYGCGIDNRACNNVNFYNNVVWNSASTSGTVQWRFYNPTASLAPPPFNVHPVSNIVIDHNISSPSTNVYWNGGSSTPIATWNTNNCTNGVIATPQIEITGTDVRWDLQQSFIPTVGGNCSGTGVDMSSYYTVDYLLQSWGGTYSKGAIK